MIRGNFVPRSWRATSKAGVPRFHNIDKYTRGAYFPIYLDDTFDNGRYRVEAKLGEGASSQTWFAKDLKQNQYVALKFVATSGDKTSYTTEVSLLQHVQRQASLMPEHPGHKYIRKYFDHFYLEYAQKQYVGLVMELAGQSLGSYLLTNRLPFDEAKSIVRQIVDGLAFLQHECEVAHGDLRPYNICFASPDFHSMSDDDVRKQIRPTHREKIQPTDGPPLDPCFPQYTVPDATLKAPGPIKIIDLDRGWRFGDRPDHIGVFATFRPPEMLESGEKMTNDTGLDSWLLASTIWRICTWGNLFDELQADRVLKQIKQTINNPRRSARTQLQGRLKKDNPKLAQRDQEGLALLIVGLIQRDPSLRSTAKDLQKDAWLYDTNS